MKWIPKWITPVFLFVLAFVGGYFAFSFLWGGAGPTGHELAAYFEEQITSRAVEEIGQPIEGFDAELLIAAYPGLVEADFGDVQTLEGKYETEEGVMRFTRTQSMPVSSAEKMITSAGYVTLLGNLAERFQHVLHYESDVDALINLLDTGGTISLSIGETGSVEGVTITAKSILEDSRCPEGVQCIQAGTVRVFATMESGLGTAEQVFELGQTITTEAEEVTLVSVTPIAEAGVVISESEYIFNFEIRERSLLVG